MEAHIEQFFAGQPWLLLAGEIVVLLAILGKAADKLVGEAVVLSERAGLPKVVIGATIVSLGTTTPEAAVSVLAAIQGKSGLALGNAVGSIICDTGLILGLVCLINPPAVPRKEVNRQAWIQLAAGVLLVLCCWPWGRVTTAFTEGGNLPQLAGVVFVLLLAVYMWLSVKWARQVRAVATLEEYEKDAGASSGLVIAKLVVALLLVVAASHFLIPAVTEAAHRMHIPEGVIAATIVAFGTSLPEMVTAVTAARQGHGDLAVGNIIGADILNVLFVSGTAAAVTPGGLHTAPEFFRYLFPAMLFVLILFRVGAIISPDRLPRPFGYALLAAYGIALYFTLLNPGE